MQSRKCDFIAYYLKAEAEKKLDEFALNSIGIEEVEAKFTIKSNNSSVMHPLRVALHYHQLSTNSCCTTKIN
jgi:hypothetical protein